MDALHTAYAGYSFIGRERLPVLAGGLSDLDDFSTDAVAVMVLIDLGMFTIIVEGYRLFDFAGTP
jgi:hypothetical protein